MNGNDETQQMTILYVDDEEMALKYFTRAFSEHFNVITSTSANDGRLVLDKRSGEISVLLTDQRMPNETGVKLLEYARNTYPYITRLLTTAFSDIQSAIDAVNKGEIYRYITKPWNNKELHNQLNDAVLVNMQKRHEQELLKEKRLATFQLAGNIAHELRTPLLSIKASANGTINYLPALIDAYLIAKKEDPLIPDIRNTNLKKMSTIFDDIIKDAQHSLTIIDILMANAANKHGNPDSYESFSMRDCIKDTLQRYPFKNGQEDIVSFSDEIDFQCFGAPTLMTHIFFNLLKNALYSISANSNKGSISIRLEVGSQVNKVFFKDDSIGIEPSVLPYIFQDFYSTKSTGLGHNIGLGLTFCKQTIEQVGGTIECNSKSGEYTEFVIVLPLVNEK